MKKFYFLLFILSIFLNSCTNSEGLLEETPSNTNFNYDYGSTVSRDFYGTVLDRSGNPVSGAAVSIGSSTTQTTNRGYFILKNVSVKEKFAHVKVNKSGFVNASRVLVPTTGNNRINVMMIPATTTATIPSGSVSTVSLSDGTKVKFNGNFKDANGNAYSGNVNVALFNLKPSDTYFNETMPGNLVASDAQGNPRVLESFGMIHVQLTGSAGQNLQLANSQTAEITMPVDATQTSTAPATIPLWSFDEEMGIWKLDGTATKTGNVYVGNVSHFSWWNCDYPYPLCNLSVTVTNVTNQPLSGIKIGISLATQIYPNVLITNNNGNASGLVPANQNLVLKIYDQCNNVIYTSNIGPFTANSNNSVPVSIANITPTFTITGTLQDCAGNNVTNGMMQLSYPTTANYFANNVQLVTNGSFSFTTLACSSTQQFVLNGYDYTNLQTTGNINFTAIAPVTNVGAISTCNAVSEFIAYQIDNQAPKTLLPPIGTTYSTSATNPGTSNALVVTCYPPNSAQGGFQVVASNVTGVGTYSNYNFLDVIGSGLPNGIPATGNNLILQISNLGSVDQYIDFTINGTFTNSTGSHTLSVTGHVLRDQ